MVCLAGGYTALDITGTEHNLESKKEAEESKLHTMAKVHDVLEMWEDSQNLDATQKESCTQNKRTIAMRYIFNTEEIIKASRSLFQLDGAAACQLSTRSPLPPALSAKGLPGGPTQVLNVHWIGIIDRHPGGSEEDRAPESISDTKNWLNRDGDIDIQKVSEVDREVDDKYEIELGNAIGHQENLERQIVCAAQNVPGLIRITNRWMKQAQ